MNLQVASDEDFGRRTELRFAEALATFDKDEPRWFMGMEESPPLLDLAGIDFIAWVKYPGQRYALPVPLQIKSSDRWVEKYHAHHPDAKEAGVVIVIARPWDTPHKLRGKLFAELQRVRAANIRYEDYFMRLLKRRIRQSTLTLIESIERMRVGQARARYAAKHKPPPAPPHRPIQFLPPELNPLERLYYRLRGLLRGARVQSPPSQPCAQEAA